MWSLLSRRWQLMIVLGTGGLLAWSLSAAWGLLTGAEPSAIQRVSLVATIIGAGLATLAELVWKWLWRRFPAIEPKTFPDLTGVWEGTLVSTWIDPATGQPKPPIPTTITIRQGLFSTHVSLRTGESTSYSTRSFLEPFYDTRRYRVWYSYNNDPHAQFQNRSSPHEGVAFLEVDYDLDPERLIGRYYTARKTTGDLDVRRTSRNTGPRAK